MEQHKRKMAKIEKGYQDLAMRHSKEQIKYWHDEIQRELSKNVSGLLESLTAIRGIIMANLHEPIAQKVCEAILTEEQRVSKAYKSCGYHLKKTLGIPSLVPQRSWQPATASTITIPSDDEGPPPPPMMDESDTEEGWKVKTPTPLLRAPTTKQQTKKRPLLTSIEAESSSSCPPPKRHASGTRPRIPDNVSESSYRPSQSPEPESNSTPPKRITRSHISPSTSFSSSQPTPNPTPSPEPEITTASVTGNGKNAGKRPVIVPSLQKHGWPRAHTSDPPISMRNLADIRAPRISSNNAVPVADMGDVAGGLLLRRGV